VIKYGIHHFAMGYGGVHALVPTVTGPTHPHVAVDGDGSIFVSAQISKTCSDGLTGGGIKLVHEAPLIVQWGERTIPD